jgi:MFS family permease
MVLWEGKVHLPLQTTPLTSNSLVNSAAFTDTFDSPSPTITGLIVAIYEVGCFFGSVATSIFGEQIGRKKSIGTGVVIMIIGALLQATAYSRAHLIVARIVSGVGMGFINSTVPVFQSEFSPKATRGLCRFLLSIVFQHVTDVRRCLHATLDPQSRNLPGILD